MAEKRYENYWDSGMRKWLDKTSAFEFAGVANKDFKAFTDYLIACDIKSDIKRDKLLVSRSGLIFMDFVISHIVAVTLYENYIIIDSMDGLSYKLLFVSPGEATQGFDRLMYILNGFDMLGCNDHTLLICKSSQNIAVSFN